MLGYAPRAIHMKKIADEGLPQRETVVYGYRPLGDDPRGRVFPPPNHRSILTRIYSNLGLEREFASPEAAPLNLEASPLAPEFPHFDLSAQVKSAIGVALIEIAGYGPGIEQEVKDKLRDLCCEGIAVVYLHLPLGDPHTAVICQRFEKLGFFFSGILPRPAEPTGPDGAVNSGDWLCLQYLSGPRIDYDLLQIYSDFGQELARYVRERDPLA